MIFRGQWKRYALAALLSVFWSTMPTANAETPEPPYVVVLGTAQDGGLPQIGCTEETCEAARRDPKRRRLVTSLLVAEPESGRRWLIDATPDLREQVELARAHPPSRQVDSARPPLFDGIFITHAHMGHYAGLLQLSRPAYGAKGAPVYGPESVCAFLQSNEPWGMLVRDGNIALRPMSSGTPLHLSPTLSITGIEVPHRDEFSRTFAYVVRGLNQAVLYLPDIDKWEHWDTRIEDVIASVDVALLDGTFFADGEIPGRSMADIPHPFIAESLERFAELPGTERSKIAFTHLNHTNPAAVRGSGAEHTVIEAGMRVAAEGERHSL